MGISANIRRYREQHSLTQEQLAAKLDVARSTVTQWETGWTSPRMGMIQKIAGVFGVSVSELVSEELAPIPGAITLTPSKPAYLPLLGRVHAGEAQEPDLLDRLVAVPFEVAERHKDAYLLEVEGDCMDKVYPEGCLILVDPHMKPSNGSIVAVAIDGSDYVMRRLYRGAHTLILSPDSFNGEHQDIVLKDEDNHEVDLAGVVVWFQAAKELE